MNKYFSFLRAINVGGHVVKMDALRDLFITMGFSNVETFIASGNVIFESKEKNPAALEKQIEKKLQEALGYEVATFIRTPDELSAMANYLPFPKQQIEKAGAFNVAFLKQPLDFAQMKKLQALKTEIDDFQVNGRELYWLCRVKQSESKFSNAVLERSLGIQATFRGMSTVNKLIVKYCE
jgi:uncharacterized protein (DUF1697 family)